MIEQPTRVSCGINQSTSVLSGTGLKSQKFNGTGDVDLLIRQFEHVSADNGWDEYMSLTQLHKCSVGDVMPC